MSKVSCTISFKSFVPESSGYEAVMQSSTMGNVCNTYAASLASAANMAAKRGTYASVPAIVHGDRMVALAHTADYEARIDENKRKTLSRLVS